MAEMGLGFTTQIVESLQQSLDISRVKSRRQQGQDVSYLESWDVIDTANNIFGFDQWTTRIVDVKVEDLGIRAIVEVKVRGVTREDVGFNAYAVAEGKAPTKRAMETSLKGAVSDAMKRAFRTFGPQFGNDLYDKENEDRADNQGRQRNSNRQSGGQRNNRQSGNRASSGEQRKPNGVETDESGREVLSGKPAEFRQYVERNNFDWNKFLRDILDTETLQAYFDSGGTPMGAVNAFHQYAEDRGIEVK